MSALNKFDSFSTYTPFAPRFSYVGDRQRFSVPAKKHIDSHLNFTFRGYPSSTSHASKLNYTFSPPSNRDLAASALSISPQSSAHQEGEEGINKKAFFASVVSVGCDIFGVVLGSVNPVVFVANKIFSLNFTVPPVIELGAGVGIIKGGLDVLGGIAQVRTAEKVSDVAGSVLGYLKIAGGSTGVFCSLLQTISTSFLLTASKVLAMPARVLGSVGGGLSLFGILFAGVNFGITLDECRCFREELNACLTDSPAKALKHLKKLISISSEETAQMIKTLEVDPAYLALTPAKRSELVKEKKQQLIEKKETFLKRVTSDTCLDLIRSKGEVEASAVVEAVLAKNQERLILDAISIALVSISGMLVVAGFLVANPYLGILLTVIGILVTLGGVLVDIYKLMQNLREGNLFEVFPLLKLFPTNFTEFFFAPYFIPKTV